MGKIVNTNANFFFQLDEFYLDLREDGHSISFLEKKEIEKKPFPGLRPFKTSEFQLFNGRDGQAEELINRFKKTKFLSVIGSSGTGKSSLVRAGLIPQLLAGYLYEAGTNWDIIISRPGKDPVENLAVALARTKSRSNDDEKINKEYNLIKPLLSNSVYGLLEVNELLNPTNKPKEEKTNLGVIIDQFEELFRFNRDDLEKQDNGNHFINLLLTAALKADIPVYVIITMRSEFLGDCARYRGLPEIINEGQYLVPQLSREHLKEVIEDPITLAGKKIAPGLVELLVNEIEESKTKKDLDQLPILQHALMRTYQEAMKNPNVIEITYEHYKAAGGMENALANHAEKKYSELADGVNKESLKQKIAKIIFQALTDASTDQKKGRRPTDLKTLYHIAESLKAKPGEVDGVINHFRNTDTSFIMPPLNTMLFPELIMDISHESLMRQWSRLKDWVSEEAENGKMLIRLSEYQKLNKEGTKDFLEGKELLQLSEWYHSFNPQLEWATRYSPDYKESLKYLQKSEQRRKIKRVSILLATIAGLILISAFLINIYKEKRKVNEEQQIAIEKVKINLANLLKNRQNAIENENKLQALFFTTEVLLLENDQKIIDSILSDSKRLHLLPTYLLKDYFFCSSEINYALPRRDYKTIYIWTADSLLSEIDLETGATIRSSKYKPDNPDSNKLIIPIKTKSFINIGSVIVDTKDTLLVDSSLYFKRKFADVFEKDPAGFTIFPQHIGQIYGASFSADATQILSWGENSESIYNAVDIWTNEGLSSGVSLIHDGINGAVFSYDKNFIFSWGIDSTIRLWQRDTIDVHLPARLFKMEIQIATGVEMDENYTIKIIPVKDYIKRKKEFIQEENKLQSNTSFK